MLDPNTQFPNTNNQAQHMIDMQQQHMMHQQLYLNPPQNVHMPPAAPMPYSKPSITQHQFVYQQSNFDQRSDQVIYQPPSPNISMPPLSSTQIPPHPTYQKILSVEQKTSIWPLLIGISGIILVAILVMIWLCIVFT